MSFWSPFEGLGVPGIPWVPEDVPMGPLGARVRCPWGQVWAGPARAWPGLALGGPLGCAWALWALWVLGVPVDPTWDCRCLLTESDRNLGCQETGGQTKHRAMNLLIDPSIAFRETIGNSILAFPRSLWSN